MKLNLDCVRDVLIYTAKNQKYGQTFQLIDYKELATKYSPEDIYYSLIKLKEAKYIKATVTKPINILIADITWEGHQFLDNVRDNTVWSNVKKKSKAIGTYSLKMIAKVAESYILNKLGI